MVGRMTGRDPAPDRVKLGPGFELRPNPTPLARLEERLQGEAENRSAQVADLWTALQTLEERIETLETVQSTTLRLLKEVALNFGRGVTKRRRFRLR